MKWGEGEECQDPITKMGAGSGMPSFIQQCKMMATLPKRTRCRHAETQERNAYLIKEISQTRYVYLDTFVAL